MPTSFNKRKIQKTNRFARDVRNLSSEIQGEAFKIATLLSENILEPNLSLKQLTGFRGIYRVVVVRDYRLIFSFDNENIYLLRIGHRREIYRNLEL